MGGPQALLVLRLAEAGRMVAAGKFEIETARIWRCEDAGKAPPRQQLYIELNTRVDKTISTDAWCVHERSH